MEFSVDNLLSNYIKIDVLIAQVSHPWVDIVHLRGSTCTALFLSMPSQQSDFVSVSNHFSTL